jgi:hypothetical protein
MMILKNKSPPTLNLIPVMRQYNKILTVDSKYKDKKNIEKNRQRYVKLLAKELNKFRGLH